MTLRKTADKNAQMGLHYLQQGVKLESLSSSSESGSIQRVPKDQYDLPKRIERGPTDLFSHLPAKFA